MGGFIYPFYFFLIFFIVFGQIQKATNKCNDQSGSIILPFSDDDDHSTDDNPYISQSACYSIDSDVDSNRKMTSRFKIGNTNGEKLLYSDDRCSLPVDDISDGESGDKWFRFQLMNEYDNGIQSGGGFIEDYAKDLTTTDEKLIQDALDEFTACVLRKSRLDQVLPDFLGETLMEIFGEECSSAISPIPAEMRPPYPCPKECENDIGCVKKCAHSSVGCVAATAIDSVAGKDCDYSYTLPSDTYGMIQECYLARGENSRPKCVDKKEPNGFCLEDEHPLECGNCVHHLEGGHMLMSCKYKERSEKEGYERECDFSGERNNDGTYAERSNCPNEMPKTTFTDKLMNATIHCLSIVNTISCCEKQGVVRECFAMCGATDAEAITSAQMNICNLHMGSIMKCYIEQKIGKAYGESEKQCAKACKICDSVKSCSLPHYLPGPFGDFASALCMLNANMDCQMAKMRGGCI